MLRITTAVLLLTAFAPPTQASTIIHAGRLIDGRSEEVRSRVSIVIDDGKITKVMDGFAKPLSLIHI